LNGQCKLIIFSKFTCLLINFFTQFIFHTKFYIVFEFSSDEEINDVNANRNRNENSLPGPPVGPNPFLEISQNIPTVEYKKGYVMRKCCIDSNNKKSE
jgi:hypothetical protein